LAISNLKFAMASGQFQIAFVLHLQMRVARANAPLNRSVSITTSVHRRMLSECNVRYGALLRFCHRSAAFLGRPTWRARVGYTCPTASCGSGRCWQRVAGTDSPA
jgi:hypothetical protein